MKKVDCIPILPQGSHIGLVVLEKKISVLINLLLQNINLMSVLSKICPNCDVMSDRTDTFRELCYLFCC